MRLRRSHIPGYFFSLLAAVGLFFCATSRQDCFFPHQHPLAGAAKVAIVTGEASSVPLLTSGTLSALSPDLPDEAGIIFHHNHRQDAALVPHGGSRLLAGLHRGSGPQKKASPAFSEKSFESCSPLRRMESVSLLSAVLPAKNKPYEAFPFNPRSPCSIFPG